MEIKSLRIKSDIGAFARDQFHHHTSVLFAGFPYAEILPSKLGLETDFTMRYLLSPWFSRLFARDLNTGPTDRTATRATPAT